jgi:hypothetical protein
MPPVQSQQEMTMRRVTIVAMMVCATVAASSGSASAQTSLVDLMSNLFLQNIVLAKTPAGVGIATHVPNFSDPTVVATTGLINQVSQQLGLGVSTFPLGSSAGGFTYGYDPALGTFSRTTPTFGPAFAERAATVGKGKVSFGMNYVHASYDTLDGESLQNGAIKFNLLHQVLNPPSYVQGDVIQASLSMNLVTDTTAFFVNYGVSDRLDIALAVPIVRVNMDLTYHAAILDFATHVVSPTTHTFADGSKAKDFTSSGSASGVGDVIVRAKYGLSKSGPVGTAVGLDVRLKTGDKNNMLGSGVTQTELFMILSGNAGDRLAPHANVGYTFAGGNSVTNVSDQFNYVGGLELNITPRVTVVGDLVGRRFRNALRLSDTTTPHTFQQGPNAVTETTMLETAAVTPDSLSSVLGTAGVKFNPWRNLLVSAHLLFPLNDAGLRSKVTPVVGFDYSF